MIDGILEIECEDGSKVIVNRHVPNREIWVAARSGGFHFRAEDGRWRDTRGGEELAAALDEDPDGAGGAGGRVSTGFGRRRKRGQRRVVAEVPLR